MEASVACPTVHWYSTFADFLASGMPIVGSLELLQERAGAKRLTEATAIFETVSFKEIA